MPIKIPNSLPATEVLSRENIFVMDEGRAETQDIRPLRIALLNLMPTKIVTETQIARLLSNSPLQVELTFLHTISHKSSHTSEEHLNTFYTSWMDVRDQKFDGLIITGAPVENLEFTEVDYWDELCNVFRWSLTNVFSTFHICWAAQAGLYYHYGIKKYPLDKKMFGIFEHNVAVPTHPLMRGFDETFLAPHSRHTEVRAEDIRKSGKLDVLAESPEAGVYIAAARDSRMFFVTGHSEYDAETLSLEYKRDISRGLPIDVPYNYYPDNDPDRLPLNRWRGHAHLLFSNWLNYFVYQLTPYDINRISGN